MSLRLKTLPTGQEAPWKGQNECVWIDLENPTGAEIDELKGHFNLNPLALEDALETDHWSRFERYPEHFFLILRTLSRPERIGEDSDEIDLFWFPESDVLLTFRNGPVGYLESVWQEAARFKQPHAVNVIYTLLQRGTDTFFTYIDTLEETTDTLEQRVLSGRLQKRTRVYAEVLKLRRTLILARKLVANASENVKTFVRYAGEISDDAIVLLRDADSHLERAYDSLDTARELVNSLLDIYFAAQNTRMNETVRTLTTVSTVFLPLTFLAGVWGMNFDIVPEFGWRYGYLFAWSCFATVGGLLLWYFKRRGWW